MNCVAVFEGVHPAILVAWGLGMFVSIAFCSRPSRRIVETSSSASPNGRDTPTCRLPKYLGQCAVRH